MSKEKNELKKIGKRDIILESAFRLFEKNGFNKTKISDIAIEAGIGKGTIYEYFDSKNDIAEIWITKKFNTHMDSFMEIERESLSAEEKIKILVERESQLISDMMSNLDSVFQIMRETHFCKENKFHKNLNKILNEEFEMLVKVINSGIESGEFIEGNPKTMARAVLGAIGFSVITPKIHSSLINAESETDNEESERFSDFQNSSDNNEEDLYKILFHGLKKS